MRQNILKQNYLKRTNKLIQVLIQEIFLTHVHIQIFLSKSSVFYRTLFLSNKENSETLNTKLQNA